MNCYKGNCFLLDNNITGNDKTVIWFDKNIIIQKTIITHLNIGKTIPIVEIVLPKETENDSEYIEHYHQLFC